MHLKQLKIGCLSIWPPVVLAPMAGVTDYPFRKLCLDNGVGLAISEMVTAHCLLANNRRTQKIATFYDDGYYRSIQLYGSNPTLLGKAVAYLSKNQLVDHIDLNFGCPMKKITAKGQGAALPYQVNLYARIIRAAVEQANGIPITVKIRMGIDEAHLYYLEAGRIAQEEGVSAVTLHARTAQQLYSGQANWEAIAKLKQALAHIPVLGNGDLYSYQDIVSMHELTQCDGFMIGRGCLGKPWLFSDIKSLLQGDCVPSTIEATRITEYLIKHLSMQIRFVGEAHALKSFRKQIKWYVLDLENGEDIFNCFLSATNFNGFISGMQQLTTEQTLQKSLLSSFKGKQKAKNKVSLPNGFLLAKNRVTPYCDGPEPLVSGG